MVVSLGCARPSTAHSTLAFLACADAGTRALSSLLAVHAIRVSVSLLQCS